jgi:NAD(P)H-quinone oxidoreductase subunit I
LSVTEEYELSTFDRHELNFDSVAMGRLPYKVTEDPMVRPIREFAYLPEGAISGHQVAPTAQRAGQLPAEIVAATQAKSVPANQEAEVE